MDLHFLFTLKRVIYKAALSVFQVDSRAFVKFAVRWFFLHGMVPVEPEWLRNINDDLFVHGEEHPDMAQRFLSHVVFFQIECFQAVCLFGFQIKVFYFIDHGIGLVR